MGLRYGVGCLGVRIEGVDLWAEALGFSIFVWRVSLF